MIKNIPHNDYVESTHFITGSKACQTIISLFAENHKVAIAVFDLEGNQVGPLVGSLPFCQRYASLDKPEKVMKQCMKFHKELFASAIDRKKPRIMKCHMGLFCFTIPMAIDDRIVGFISGGHVLSGEPREECIHRLRMDYGDNEEIWENYQSLQTMTRKGIEAIVERLSDALKSCIEEAYDKHQSTRQLRKLIFASKINEMVNTKMRLEDLLKRTTTEIADAIDVDVCLIMLLDREHKDFILSAVNVDLPEDDLKMKFRVDEGVTGIVAATRRYVFVKDAQRDPRVVRKSLGFKSLLSLPLKVGEDIIGVLHIGTLKKMREFTHREIAFIEALTSEAALAVNSTVLYEESVRKTEELKRSKMELQSYFSQIGTALSSALNLNQLLRMIVELSIKLIGADAGSLYLIEDRRLSTQVAIGLENGHASPAQFRLRESLLGWGDDGELLQSEGSVPSTELLRPRSAQDDIKSYLGIPLAVKEELIGLLNMYTKDSREFQPEKIELLLAFANQAAMAIDNALNYEKEQRRAREATLLYEAARAIGQSFDMSEILNITVEHLVQITQIDRCLIFLSDDHEKDFYLAAYRGLSVDQNEFFALYRFTSHEISQDIRDDLLRGRSRIFSGMPPDCPALEKLFNLIPTNSCLLVPLIAREKLLGVIFLDDSQVAHYFSDSQIRLVMTLSIQIATAIQRSRLITKQEENTNQLKALLQVSSVLPTSLSLPKVFNLVVEKAAQLVSKPAIALLIMDDDINDFVLEASRGLEESLLDSELQKEITRSAVEKKRYTILTIDDTSEGKMELALWMAGIGGVLSIPLIAKRRLVGVLNCFSDAGHHFTFEEIRLLRSFANHAAIAVENARLHGIVRNKVRELATLFEVGKAITSTLDFERVLEEITKNINRAMSTDACSIMMLDEEQKELSIKTATGLARANYGSKIKLGEGIAGIAAKTGRPMILLDLPVKKSVYKFPRSIREEGLKTILSVPLETKGKIIGLINVYLKDIYYYKPYEISLLRALSNQAAIAIENARLYEAQANVAKILQSIVMPQKEFVFPGLEIGYHYISSLELSGDYFDLIPLSSTKMSLVIADVSGKGPPAAIYTARAKYILKSYAIAGYQPREILAMVNNLIVPETGDEKFISLFYVEIDLKKKLLRFSSAGHEPPIYCRTKTRELSLLETEGLLIGVTFDAKFKQEELPFENGDVLVLYTDGITEARGNKGEIFGIERLMEIVKKQAHLEPQALANRIYTAVQKYTRRKLNDDFSLLVVRL